MLVAMDTNLIDITAFWLWTIHPCPGPGQSSLESLAGPGCVRRVVRVSCGSGRGLSYWSVLPLYYVYLSNGSNVTTGSGTDCIYFKIVIKDITKNTYFLLLRVWSCGFDFIGLTSVFKLYNKWLMAQNFWEDTENTFRQPQTMTKSCCGSIY